MMHVSWASLVLAFRTALSVHHTFGSCVYPEVCKSPPYAFKKVLPVKGRLQWDESGGFCGSLSIQTMALTYGAWISQDRARMANRGGLCFGHTDEKGGCEVGPENYGLTAHNLKLAYDEWNFMQPAPQAFTFKQWIKSHLVKGQPVMWAPMLKRNVKSTSSGRVSFPGDGKYDHQEPIIGIGSNHDLSDSTVYEDDWLVHYSNYDLQPCYRNFSSLDDGPDMEGNCKDARTTQGPMYPCFYKKVTYGLALRGLNMFGASTVPRVSLEVDRPDEPRVRLGHAQALMQGTITVHGVTPGLNYMLYRFNSTQALPDGMAIDLLDMTYHLRYSFVPDSETWRFEDPQPIMSDSSTYYVAILANKHQVEIADLLQGTVPKAFLRSVQTDKEKADLLREHTVDLLKERADPELSRAPFFKSLAEVPEAQDWRAVVMIGIPICAVAILSFTVVHRMSQRNMQISLLEPPLLG